MKTLQFCAFGLPVPKERPRFSKGGHAYTPERTRDYQEFIRDVAANAVVCTPGWPMDAEYRVDCTMYFPDRRRRDGINVMCSLQDAMNKVVYGDDHQIKSGHYEVRYDKDDPRLEVCVTVIERAK